MASSSNRQPSMEPEPVAIDVPIEDREYDSEETIEEEPISKYRPRGAATTPLVDPRSSPKASEMQKKPDWLPKNWRMEVIKRTSGICKGRSDNYYFSPTGERLRSRIAVEEYLKKQDKTEATSQATMPVENTLAKKKRGRPRKYGVFSCANHAPSPTKQDCNDGDEAPQASEVAK